MSRVIDDQNVQAGLQSSHLVVALDEHQGRLQKLRRASKSFVEVSREVRMFVFISIHPSAVYYTSFCHLHLNDILKLYIDLALTFSKAYC